jgi:predicted CoA-binding protein
MIYAALLGPKACSMPITDDQELRRILDDSLSVAVVGLSDQEDRSSHGIAEFLHDRGYLITPVNPNIAEFRGTPAVAVLSEIEGPIDIVNVFRRPEFAPDIARAAVAAGAGTLWLQAGIVSDEAMEIAEAGGLKAVQDRCIAVTHRMLGLA